MTMCLAWSLWLNATKPDSGAARLGVIRVFTSSLGLGHKMGRPCFLFWSGEEMAVLGREKGGRTLFPSNLESPCCCSWSDTLSLSLSGLCLYLLYDLLLWTSLPSSSSKIYPICGNLEAFSEAVEKGP